MLKVSWLAEGIYIGFAKTPRYVVNAVSTRARKLGFSLVEVTFALAIVTFASFALVGVLLVGLRSGSDSKQRFQAATIAESICATLRAAPAVNYSTASNVTPNFPIPVLTTTANNFSSPTPLTWDGEKLSSFTDSSVRFGLIYNITAPANYVTSIMPGKSILYLCIYWPPTPSIGSAGSHYEVTTTFALP